MAGKMVSPVGVLNALSTAGLRGPVSERALSSLAAQAGEYGLEEVVSWVMDDSGLLSIPSLQFEFLPPVKVE